MVIYRNLSVPRKYHSHAKELTNKKENENRTQKNDVAEMKKLSKPRTYKKKSDDSI